VFRSGKVCVRVGFLPDTGGGRRGMGRSFISLSVVMSVVRFGRVGAARASGARGSARKTQRARGGEKPWGGVVARDWVV